MFFCRAWCRWWGLIVILFIISDVSPCMFYFGKNFNNIIVVNVMWLVWLLKCHDEFYHWCAIWASNFLCQRDEKNAQRNSWNHLNPMMDNWAIESDFRAWHELCGRGFWLVYCSAFGSERTSNIFRIFSTKYN